MKNSAFIDYCNFAGGTDRAAKKLRISYHTAAAYRRGVRSVSPEIAEKIESDTGGKIDRVSLVWPGEAA